MHPRFHEQAAMLRYQELVDQGMREQFVASVLPPPVSTPAVLTALRHHLSTLLAGIRLRLRDAHAGARPWLASGDVSAQDAIASSHEPVCCLIPRHLL